MHYAYKITGKATIPFFLLLFGFWQFFSGRSLRELSHHETSGNVGILLDTASTPGFGHFEELKILASNDIDPGDHFGRTTIISGTLMFIGSDFNSANGVDSGTVYIFEIDAGGENNWGQVKKITPADGASGDGFGLGLAFDGDTLAVGAYLADDNGSNSGAVYIFERNLGGPNNWGERTKILSFDGSASDRFGWGLDIDGDTLIVGALQEDSICSSCNSGAAYLFERDEGGADNWGFVKKLVPGDLASNDQFGRAVQISGDTIFITAGTFGDFDFNRLGRIYVYARNVGGTNNWGELTLLTASDGFINNNFGFSMQVHEDTLLVGARNDDDGGANAGALYLFERDAGGADNWGETAKLTAPDAQAGDQFGAYVAIHGDTLVGTANLEDEIATNAGAAYVFSRQTGGPNDWTFENKLLGSGVSADDRFGVWTSIWGETLVIGAHRGNIGGAESGEAYLYQRDYHPAAIDDTGAGFTTTEDSAFTTANVLDNDLNPVEGGIILIGVDFSAVQGSITNNQDGTFSYDPDGNFDYLSHAETAAEVFEYTIENSLSLTDTGTVTITVTGVNAAPVVEDEDLFLDHDEIFENGTVQLNAAFSDIDANDSHFVVVSWGDTMQSELDLAPGELSFSIDHQYLDDPPGDASSGQFVIGVTIDDGLATDSAQTSVTVNNTSPQISNLSFTPEVDENDLVVLSGNLADPGSLDTFTLQVSWGDGTVDQTNLPAGSTAFNANHTYLDDDADDLYVIFLTVTDDDGGLDTDQGVVSVHNVAPTVDAGADIMAAALLPVFFDGSFSDPGTVDTHTIVWNFGDGTFAYDTLTPTHVYTQPGEYSVTLTVTDDDGGIGGDTVIVSVGDAPFRIWIPILTRED